jgi:cell division protein FtsB
LQKAANKLGNQTLFSQDEFTRGFALLTTFRSIGVDSYERVAKSAADLAQINEVDVKTSFMQLAKALEDPERNLSTLNRSGISFNKTQIDTIKQLTKTGETAKAHAMILKIIEKAYKDASVAAGEGFAGNVDALKESFDDLSESLGKALLPVLDSTVQGLTVLVNFLNSEGGQTAVVIAGIGLAVKGLTVAGGLLSAQLTILTAKFGATSAGAIALAKAQATASISTKALAIATGGLAIAMNALPMIALATGFIFLTNAIIKAINRQKEFNDLIEKGSSADLEAQIKKTTKTIEDLETKIKKMKDDMGFMYQEDNSLEHQLRKARKELERLQTRLPMIQGVELFRDFEKAKNALIEKNAQLKETEERMKIGTEEGRKQFDLEKRKEELVEKYGEELAQQILNQEAENRKIEDSIKLLKDKEKEAKKLKETMKAIGEEIEANIKDNLADAIMGAKSFGDAMNDVLNKIKRKLLDLALDKMFQGFQSGFSGKKENGAGNLIGSIIGGLFKANGGPVKAGQPYIVGERQPELFIPNRSGTIIPSVASGGDSITNIVNVSVDATGSTVQGDQAGSQELGQTIALVVQETLVREKRSGGLLA